MKILNNIVKKLDMGKIIEKLKRFWDRLGEVDVETVELPANLRGPIKAEAILETGGGRGLGQYKVNEQPTPNLGKGNRKLSQEKNLAGGPREY